MVGKTMGMVLVGIMALVGVGAVAYAVQNIGPGWMMGSTKALSESEIDRFYEKMSDERNEMIEARSKLANGEITQEQFNDLMLEHMEEMQQLHEESGIGCPMMGSSSAARVGGFGMMGRSIFG